MARAQSSPDIASPPDIAGAAPVSFGDKKTVTELNGFRAALGHCDARGNIYSLVFDTQHHFIDKPPALDRITPAAAVGASFSAGKGSLVGAGFGPGGEAAIVMNRDRLAGFSTADYLLRFDADGKLESETRFPKNLGARGASLALFPDGNLLVVRRSPPRQRHLTGYYDPSAENRRHSWTPSIAIYDHQAKLVTEVQLPDDPAVYVGDAVSGPDGNIYLMGARVGVGITDYPAIIYVVAPSGKVVRRVVVAAPASYMVPNPLQVADGRIAILFFEVRTWQSVVSVNDWTTGERIALYQLPNKTRMLACYDARTDAMTFLDEPFPLYPANKVSLRVASPVR